MTGFITRQREGYQHSKKGLTISTDQLSEQETTIKKLSKALTCD